MGRVLHPVYLSALLIVGMSLFTLVSERTAGKAEAPNILVASNPQSVDSLRMDFELAVLSRKLENISPSGLGACLFWNMPERLSCMTSLIEPTFAKKSEKKELKFIPPVYGIVTSGFGFRIPPHDSDKEDATEVMHTGIDLAAPREALFVAPADGTVTEITYKTGYGAILTIEHDASYETIYAHVGSLFIKVGEKVRTGQPLGVVGMSGKTTGPHIHFEMKIDGKFVDPQPYLDLVTKKELAVLMEGN